MKITQPFLKFEDDLEEFSIYPLTTKEYIEYFKNNPNDSFENPSLLLSIYINIINKGFRKKQSPYSLLKGKFKKLTLVIQKKETITLDLTNEIGNGILLNIEYQSLGLDDIEQEKLLQIHGNTPINEYYSKIKNFYRYTSEDNKYINNIYLIKFCYISEKDYEDLCLRQLLEALNSIYNGNYIDTILKCQISNEIITKNICQHKELIYNKRNYPENLDMIESQNLLISFPKKLFNILKEINTIRNNIIYMKNNSEIKLDQVARFFITSLIFYEYFYSIIKI